MQIMELLQNETPQIDVMQAMEAEGKKDELKKTPSFPGSPKKHGAGHVISPLKKNGRHGGDIVFGHHAPVPDARHYPLSYAWTFWAIDNQEKNWFEATLELKDVFTAYQFWQMLNNMLPPSATNRYNYVLFKKGIRPEWEHPANERGGRWNICATISDANIDKVWLELVMLLVGSAELRNLAEYVNGVYQTRKRDGHRVSVWLSTTKEQKALPIGRILQKTLATNGGKHYRLEFTESRPENGSTRGKRAALLHLD